MCVTNEICASVLYDNKFGWDEKELTNQGIINKLNSEKKRAFLSFSYGVWCTAYARNNLIQNILKLDKYLIYSDTDSVKLKESINKNTRCCFDNSIRVNNVNAAILLLYIKNYIWCIIYGI